MMNLGNSGAVAPPPRPSPPRGEGAEGRPLLPSPSGGGVGGGETRER